MPQIHTKAQEILYLDILKWVQQDIVQKYKDMTILVGGNLQATPAQEKDRSYYPPLDRFCETTCLRQLTPSDTYTFIPAKTHIDHWILQQPPAIQHYTPHNTNMTTYTTEYGDCKALKL